MTKQSTSERIVEAALKLISEKGYRAATTKAIAELAQVNEVTIFRHFGNKRGILQAIIEKFSYGPVLQKMIRHHVVWDLQEDLYNFSVEYQHYMKTIKKYVLLAFKEAGAFPEIDEELAKVPLFIKRELIMYFEEMKKRDKLIDIDTEAVVMSLIALNFGHFISQARLGSAVTDRSTEEILKASVLIFSSGLTPE